jgi:hypothetical protein
LDRFQAAIGGKNMAKKTTEKKETTGGEKKVAPAKVPDKKAPAKKPAPPKPAAKKATTREVTFLCKATQASWVSLAGEFNGWNIESGAMTRNAEGCWERTVSLSPGTYQYKFIVDGEWWADPDNPNFTHNEFGTTNSIIDV